jgi:hypothetical protein
VDDKRFRLDFVVAIGALLISTVAAVATVYQTRVIASEFSATVWPYVSFDTTYSPSLVEVDVRNDGLGPAIVRSVAITWDGKPQPSLEALFAMLAARNPRAVSAVRAAVRAGAAIKLTTSTPTAGMVIPANAQHEIVRMEGAALIALFRPSLHRFGLSLCYCSLTGSCWIQRFQRADQEPSAVRSCA